MSRFINNLRIAIDNADVYDPTGRYGKSVLNTRKSEAEKLEKFLLAEPSSAEEVNEYVWLAQSMGFLKKVKVYNRIEALIEFSNYSREEIKLAKKIFGQAKRKRILKKFLAILLIVVGLALCILWYIFYVSNWGGFWRVLWFFYGPTISLGIFLSLGLALYNED